MPPPGGRRLRTGRAGSPGLAQFELLGTAGYADVDEFLGFIERAEAGEAERGWFEGRRADCHRRPDPHRRPGPEPDAVRAPDDPDQPGDHRRRGARGLAAAGLRARQRLRTRDGTGLRSARARRHPDRGHLRHDQRVALVQPRHRPALRRAGAGHVRPPLHRLLPLPEPVHGRPAGPRARSRSRSAWAAWRPCWPARASPRSSFRSSSSRAISTRPAPPSPWPSRSSSGWGWRYRGPITGAGMSFLPKPGPLDGPRPAGVRRLHPRHRRVLRLPVLRPLQPALGRSRAGGRERAGAHRRRLVRRARSGPRRRRDGRQAGAGRRLGDVVQELPDHGTAPR